MANARPHVTRFAVLAVLLTPAPAFADSVMPPRSYKKDAPGGKYVFVMIPPADAEGNWWGEEAAAEMREIRRAYGVSGLYPADGTTKPLWTVDWYAYDVELASDGVHMVRRGPWPTLPPGDARPTDKDLAIEAVTFFARGQPVRTYSTGELVDRPHRLPRSVSHFQWLSEAKFDDARMEYTVATRDGNRFVFDVRTGEIVSQSRVGGTARWGWWVIGGATTVAAGVVLGFRLRRRKLRPS